MLRLRLLLLFVCSEVCCLDVHIFTWSGPLNISSSWYVIGSGMAVGCDAKRELEEKLSGAWCSFTVMVSLEKLCLD